jgi:NTE family protein
MKRLIALLVAASCLGMGAYAQNLTGERFSRAYEPILSSANPTVDSAAFAKVRARMDSIRQYRPTVGLVLAGGGARGLAHLGVIKYMEELGIPVDVVTGTSMGGLVGGLYALGYRHDQLDSLVRAIEWPIMMSDDIPNDYISYKLRKYRDKFIIRIPHHYDDEDLADRLNNERIADKMAEESGHTSADMLNESISRMGLGLPDGFLYGLNVRNMLSSISVGYQDSLSFADLPIPYACVATDLYAMAPKYWTSGHITDALRSTMAIPFYFRAVRQNGEVLLDGGMRNNYPVDIARAMGADLIIGSDMSIHRELNELNSPVDFLLQTITLLASSANGPAREMLDLGVHHELKGYTMLSFDDASVDDIIDQGYRNALEQKELFESIAACVAGRPTPRVASHPAAINLAQHKVRISEIRFNGIKEEEKGHLLHRSDYPTDDLFDRTVIEKMLNSIYGTNAFESVTYHLEGHEEPYTLVFDCQKGQTNDFAIGLRADTDETVAVALHYGLGTRRLGGNQLSADLKLGTNPALNLDFTRKSQIGLPTFGIGFRSRLVNSESGWAQSTEEKLLTIATDVYLEDSRMRHGSMRIGLTAEMDPYERYLEYGEQWQGWDWKSYWLSAFAHFKVDTFDDGYFPTKGVRFSLNGRYVFKGYSIDLDPYYFYGEDFSNAHTADGHVPHYISTLASFEAALSLGSRFTILPKLYAGWYQPFGVDLWEYNIIDFLNPKHAVTVGGFIPNRYTENQIPFFLFTNGYRETDRFSTMAQLDLRYCFARKNYITARTGVFVRAPELRDFFYNGRYWGFGAEYARQTMVGPLKVAAQWSPVFGFSAYASIGFDF